jgi:hypothetical protein
MGDFFGGNQPPPTQKTTVELSPEQRQIYQYALPYLRDYAATTPQRYQGSTVAGFDPNQVAGQNAVLGAAGTAGDVARGAAGANQFWTGDSPWDPANSPQLRGAIDASTRPIIEAYQEKLLPGIRGEATSTGNFGSSRQGIVEAAAARDTGRAVGDVASKTVQDLYKTNVDAQLKAMGLAPNVAATQFAEGQAISGVGDVRQAMNQAQLNELVQNFFADTGGLDFAKAKDILGLVQGMPGATTVSTGSVPKQSPFQTALSVGSAALPFFFI